MELFSTPINNIYYRKANDKDAPVIRELIFNILKSYDLKVDPIDTDNDLYNIEKYYPEGHFWVLVDSDRVIKGSFALFYPENGKAEVRRMYFDSSLRSQGLGKWALNFLENKALEHGCKLLRLETVTVLNEAIQLYTKSGFTVTDGLCHSCRCNIVMEKKLVNYNKQP